MATELEFVNYKQFVENLPARTSAKSGDKTVVSNSTDGPGSETNAAQAKKIIVGKIAFEFSNLSDYDTGVLVWYSDKIYRFIRPHSAGNFTDTDVEEVSFGDFLRYLNEGKNSEFGRTFDKPNWTLVEGGYMSASGSFVTAEGWTYYYKSVIPGERYYIRSYFQQAARQWVMLDSSNNVVQVAGFTSGSSVDTTADLIIPEGVAKLVVNNRYSSTSIVNLVLDKVTTPYVANTDANIRLTGTSGNLTKDFNLIRELNLSFGYSVDIENWEKTDGKWIDKVSYYSDAEKTSSQWSYYEKNNVVAGDKYRVKATAGGDARLWVIYDSFGTKMSSSTDSSAASAKMEDVVIPVGASKICVNARKNQSDTPPEIYIYKAYIPAENVTGLVNSPVTDKLYGKTLVCCGDSITRGADMDASGISQTTSIISYSRRSSDNEFVLDESNFIHCFGYQIAERHGMTFYKDGIDGSTIQGLSDHKGFSLANGRYTKLPVHIDYLVIFFGWNDSAYGSLGSIDDDTNGSYYGGFNVVLPYLQNKYPYAKICLVVPFGSTANHREAVRLLGNKWGVSVFDMYGAGTPLYYGKEDVVGVLSSVVTANRAKFQANGAHPNYQGHKQIADMLEQHLMSI